MHGYLLYVDAGLGFEVQHDPRPPRTPPALLPEMAAGVR